MISACSLSSSPPTPGRAALAASCIPPGAGAAGPALRFPGAVQLAMLVVVGPQVGCPPVGPQGNGAGMVVEVRLIVLGQVKRLVNGSNAYYPLEG